MINYRLITLVNIQTDPYIYVNNKLVQSGGNALTGTIPSEFGLLSGIGTFDIGKLC